MGLPLYRLEELKRERENLVRQARGNGGLIFNKYFNLWKIDPKNKSDWTIEAGEKAAWIQVICSRPAGERSLLSAAAERLIDLVDSREGQFCCYKTSWRFVTGLGLNHPIENGMLWHHTWGVPYLPGSSVKGLIRAWVEQWVGDVPQDDIKRIFGPRGTEDGDNEELEKGVGNVIFFDALPLAPVAFSADVMTPHYQKYYSSENVEPGDWMDPNPIPFLTIDSGQVFLFAAAPRRVNDAVGKSDLDTVFRWMGEALENMGAGAKTAVGYGRFERCLQSENRLRAAFTQRKEEKVKKASSIPLNLTGPISKEMIKEQYDTDPEEFLQIIKSKWVVKMQADDTSEADKITIAKLLKNWFQVYREEQWEKPNRKNTPVVKAIRRVLSKMS